MKGLWKLAGAGLAGFILFFAVPSAAQGPVVGGCPVLPANNIWNTPIDDLPAHPNSDAFIASIGAATTLHPDFGAGLWEGAPIGIPFVIVPANQPLVTINLIAYPEESDPGPYPVPPDAPIEGGPNGDGDRHVLVVRPGECILYEMYRSFPNNDGSWDADSTAKYDLRSNALRPDTWTSADAAGLPIFPGLARYEEVAGGAINHALRFTVEQSQAAYLWPARHEASDDTNPNRPPMGMRVRLKAGFVIDDSFSPQGRIILTALKKYGMLVADNGSNWYISGIPNAGWDDDGLHDDFNRVAGGDFEVVDVASLQVDPDSGEVASTLPTVSIAPASQHIQPGQSTTYQVTISAGRLYTGTVALVAGSPAPWLAVQVAPAEVNPPATATLTATDTHTGSLLYPGLWYTIPVTATAGGETTPLSVELLVGGGRLYLPVIMR